MIITKKQTSLVAWSIILILLLVLAPYTNAQEQTPPPPPPPRAGASDLAREEILDRVQDSANSVNYKLMTATAKVEQIVTRLNNPLIKSSLPDRDTVADAKRLMEEAGMSVANATDLLESNRDKIEELVQADNPPEQWQNLEIHFRGIADEIRNAIQNISVVADILLSANPGN